MVCQEVQPQGRKGPARVYWQGRIWQSKKDWILLCSQYSGLQAKSHNVASVVSRRRKPRLARLKPDLPCHESKSMQIYLRRI